MASRFPYVSSPGPFVKTIEQLRRSFPPQVTAATLKKLALAPNNETYIINTLRFLSVIDDEGKKVERHAHVFLEHDDRAFEEGLAGVVKLAYPELFELHGEEVWKLDKSQLIPYFRKADGSTEIVGGRQAATFVTLAELAGRRERAQAKIAGNGNAGTAPKRNRRPRSVDSSKPATAASAQQPVSPVMDESRAPLGLTVRVEVNLPAVDDQEVYDKIFRSIRENLIDVR